MKTKMIGIILLLALVVSPTLAQDTPTQAMIHTISVFGSGEAYGSPNMAYVELGIDRLNNNVGEAVGESNRTMNAIIAAINGLGVTAENILTTGFNVWAEDRYDPETGSPTGERNFRAQNIVRVTVRDISMVEEVIDAALTAGASNIYGLTFGIADTKALEQEARLLAIADARERAGQLADTFGVTVGEPLIISESGDTGPFTPSFAGERGGGGGFAPPVNAGQLAVNVGVNVVFSIDK